MENKVVLITGAARRVGATLVRHLHSRGMNIVLHHRHSEDDAKSLQSELNGIRKNSVKTVKLDLTQFSKFDNLLHKAVSYWGRLDVLINNASAFYPTTIGQTSEQQWDDLHTTNVKAPYFLAQAATPYLAQNKGCIINITDIHGSQPLKNYPVYCAAKAGLIMLTKSLAKELGPNIRVNAISPGAVMWPQGHEENTLTPELKAMIIERSALKRAGDPLEIAKAAEFFIEQADYVTGQILAVDGGRL